MSEESAAPEPTGLTISVNELVVNEAEKTYQVKIHSEWQDGEEPVAFTVLRTHGQMTFFVNRLNENHKDILVPILPEAPLANTLVDRDTLEKKRRQYDRFFCYLANRDDFARDPELKTFLTATQVNEPVEKKQQKAAQLLSNLVTRAEHGLKIYKPAYALVDEAEETEFEKRKIYLLQTEKNLKSALDNVSSMIRARDALGRAFSSLGEAVGGLEGVETLKLQQYNELGIQLHSVHHEQVREEIFHFGDVILEYKNHCQSFKNLLNNRTDAVIELDQAHKHAQKCKEQVEKLKRKHSDISAEVLSAQEEEEKAKKAVETVQQQLEGFREKITLEYNRFEKERVVDFKLALDLYVRTQINFESGKLRLLNQISF